jgi:hypothetical protein
MPDGLAVLDAIMGHRSLTSFICWNDESPEVGMALSRLVEAESRLDCLDISFSHLGDAGLPPLFEAVAGSRTLRTLNCGNNNISRECAHNVTLPAVRANASLRKLFFGQGNFPKFAELLEAEELVARR